MFHVISWKKVAILLILVVFFVYAGMFLYNKKNPIDTTAFDIGKIESPFSEQDKMDLQSSMNLFGTTQLTGQGDDNSAPLDATGVFKKKTAKSGENLAPIAKIKLLTSSTQESIYAGDTIFLSATDSYDPDGRIDHYRWDFDQANGMGIDAEGINTTVKYNEPGVYTVTLLTVDDAGMESTTTMSINVVAKPDTTPNNIVQGLTTNHIDIDSLGFMSRTEVQQALERSYADFTSDSYSLLAQSIYNSQKKKLAPLPSLDDIELSIGKDSTNTPPVIDSFIPKKGSEIYEQKPVIAVGFYGNNKINTHSVQLTVDGRNVTNDTLITPYGVQYKPDADLGFGQHTVMLVVEDERGLRSVASYDFEIIDRKAENADLVPEYKDDKGPQMLLHSPDANAKNVKPNSDIIVKYDEEVVRESVEIAVVDLNTNITRFFTQSQLIFDSTNTSVTVSANQSIFEYDHSYQIVARQKDKLGNESVFEWHVMAETYGPPKFEISYPENGATVSTPQVKVRGFTDPTYQIFVGNKPAVVDMAGMWEVEVDVRQGENKFDVVAKDLKGKASLQELVINYDPKSGTGDPIIVPQESPIIMDASIRDGQTTSKIRPQISFVFGDSDGIDLSSVKLLVDGEDVTKMSMIARDSITYKPLKELKQGKHDVQLIVADTKGNVTNYEMSFIVDAYPENPESLKASLTNNNENVLLTWEAVTNLENPEYRVYRSVQPNVKPTVANEIARGLKTTTFIDKDVISGTTYYYTVVAVNEADNKSVNSNEVVIRVDFTPPVLLVKEPIKNLKTHEEFVVLRGTTEVDANVEVFVNFKSKGSPKINSDGSFEMTLDLVVGENVITTVVTDKDGNETVDIRTVTYEEPDLDAPHPKKESDVSPRGVKVPVDSKIVVKYNEPINPETIKLLLKKVSDKQAAIPINMTDPALQVSDDHTTITYTPRTPFEYKEAYSVEFYVEDLAGNESYGDDWVFETEDKKAPVLEIFTPTPDFFSEKTDVFVTGKTDPNIDLEITVTSKGGETGNPNSIDQPVTYNLKSQADGTFKHLIKLYPYKENRITVKATDHLGHTTIKVVDGLSSPPDTERPYLSVTAPDSNSTSGVQNIRVTGITEPDVRVTINVNGQVQHDFDMDGKTTFDKGIRLDSAHNIIKVMATDPSGNQEMVVLTVFYDNIPPLLDVAQPIDGLTTNQQKVELRGMTERDGGVKVTVTINNSGPFTLPVMQDGMFKSNLTLATGNNYIVVRGEDRYGNTMTIIRNVYYDPVHGQNGSDQTIDGAGKGQGGDQQEHDPDEKGSVEVPNVDNSSNSGNNGSNSGNTGNTGGNEGKLEGNGSDNTGGSGDNSNGNSGETNKKPDTNTGSNTSDGGFNAGGKTDSGKNDTNSNSTNNSTGSTNSNNVDGQSTNNVVDHSTGEMKWTGTDHKRPDFVNIGDSLQHGIETNEKNQHLNGKTEPEAQVTVTQNGKEIMDQKSDVKTGGFGGEVVLEEGKNIFISNSKDASGNMKQNLDIVTLDTKGPATQIMKPSQDELTNKNRITVYGLTEPHSKVEIVVDGNTQKYTLEADEWGYFTEDVLTGANGTKNITISAFDKLKNKTEKKVRIIVDKTAPNLTLNTLNDIAIQPEFVSTGTSPRVFGVGSLTPMLKGRTEADATVKVYTDDRLVGSVKANEDGSFRVAIGSSSERVNLLRVESIDKAGNKTTLYMRLKTDREPPVLTIYDPTHVVGANNLSTSITNNTLKFSGVAEDYSYPVTLKLKLNNGAVTTVTTNNGSFSTNLTGLQKGSNIIHIDAVDAVGNSVYQTASVVYNNGGFGKFSYQKGIKFGPSTVYNNFDSGLLGKAQAASGFEGISVGPIANQYMQELAKQRQDYKQGMNQPIDSFLNNSGGVLTGVYPKPGGYSYMELITGFTNEAKSVVGELWGIISGFLGG